MLPHCRFKGYNAIKYLNTHDLLPFLSSINSSLVVQSDSLIYFPHYLLSLLHSLRSEKENQIKEGVRVCWLGVKPGQLRKATFLTWCRNPLGFTGKSHFKHFYDVGRTKYSPTRYNATHWETGSLASHHYY